MIAELRVPLANGRWFPFSSTYFVDPTFSAGTPTMLIAGDDAEAKRVVGDILVDFGWPEPIDLGGIEGSRELEVICIAWVKIGGVRGAWDHGFSLLAG